MVALETASISAPTLKALRMLFALNCSANRGGSTEKSPYGSLWSMTMIPGENPGRIHPDDYLDRTVVTALERFQLGGQEGEPEEPLLPPNPGRHCRL